MAAQAPNRRGLILMALDAQYPGGLTYTSIEQQVGPFLLGEPHALDRDLAYLLEAELIKKEDVPVPTQDLLGYRARRRRSYPGKSNLVQQDPSIVTRPMTVYKIVLKGINIVDGTIEDPGIRFASDVDA